MILTGKTLEQFKEWYEDFDKSGIKSMPYTTLKPYVCFLNIDFSMQYGVLVIFFQTLNIDVTIERRNSNLWLPVIYGGSQYSSAKIPERQTLQEARRKAIEKANELNNLLY